MLSLMFRIHHCIDQFFYKKMWDFQIFSEFLSEKYTQDELFFFLHMRNIMFGGPQINSQSFIKEVTCWVQWEKVKNIIKIQFEDQNDAAFEFLVENLNSRVVKKGRHLVIDGYFVLRMFLEFYI